ncbi:MULTISPECIES: hypothetical protein [unclassified Variovorax]|uniref:hypothetical protein n=1 Tax=unclassified Variovorax TaxID=663243 RepID=UPI0013DFCCFE|nr:MULTISPECIES: hypothetical protein [unclassified Variovorax]
MPTTWTTLNTTLATACQARKRSRWVRASGDSRRSTKASAGTSSSNTRWLEPSQVATSQLGRGTARVRMSTIATIVLNAACSVISTIQKATSTGRRIGS